MGIFRGLKHFCIGLKGGCYRLSVIDVLVGAPISGDRHGIVNACSADGLLKFRSLPFAVEPVSVASLRLSDSARAYIGVLPGID